MAKATVINTTLSPHAQQDGRVAYERNAIATIHHLFTNRRAVPRLADADVANEWRAQRLFFDAMAEFRAKVEQAAALSELRKQEMADMLVAMGDYAPTRICWDEAISAGLEA